MTEAFTAALIEFGYPPCPGGIMLSRPRWRQRSRRVPRRVARLDPWRGPGGSDEPGDLSRRGGGGRGRAAAGEARGLCRRGALRQLRLLCAVRQRRGPVRRGLVDPAAWPDRPAAAEIDIKKLGIFPIVHGVRVLALQYPSPGTAPPTVCARSSRRSGSTSRWRSDLIDALHFLIGLKLANNLRQIADGRTPDNSIRLADLGTLDRGRLRNPRDRPPVQGVAQLALRAGRAVRPPRLARDASWHNAFQGYRMPCIIIFHISNTWIAVTALCDQLRSHDASTPLRGPSPQLLLALCAAGMSCSTSRC